MVDRVRKGKINAEGGQECGLGNSISSRRQMFRCDSLLSFLLFFSLLLPFRTDRKQ